jgi:hypothetical protein
MTTPDVASFCEIDTNIGKIRSITIHFSDAHTNQIIPKEKMSVKNQVT